MPEYIVGCDTELKAAGRNKNYLALAYRSQYKRNVDLYFDSSMPFDLFDDRTKDFIEISAFLYAAEIKFSTIKNNNEEEPKALNLHIPVRDYNFWKQPEIISLLGELLYFLSGDEYRFIFLKMNQIKNKKRSGRKIFHPGNKLVTFLSGGIDPTAGSIDLLENNPGSEISLISHQAGLSGTASTQNNLFQKIDELYPGRCSHHTFRGGLLYKHSFEKEFPARTLLYSAVAFAVSRLHAQDRYYVYENGISAINFKGINSFDTSTGRSCHPKTLHLLEELFSRISENQFIIKQPFLFKTKAEVIQDLISRGRSDLLDLTVSCDRHHPIPPEFSHCGICPSCITRSNALISKGFRKEHTNLFYYDLPAETNLGNDQRKILETMLRDMMLFLNQNYDGFCRLWGDELITILEHIPDDIPYHSITERIYDLCCRHYQEMKDAIKEMWDAYASPWASLKRGTFFSILDECYGAGANGPAGITAEPEIEYSASEYEEERPALKEIPARKVKETVIEQCYELIKTDEYIGNNG